MSKGTHETEIKLAVADAASARRMLRAAGFRLSRRRVFESNVVFDTPDMALRQKRTLLRVREAGKETTLTFKGVPIDGRHKSREELETAIPGVSTLSAILDRLGFRPSFRYEKYRAEFRAPAASGVAMLDETPIGVYLELEGSPAWIDRTARKLGYGQADYITKSYASLYFADCEKRGVKPADMVFR